MRSLQETLAAVWAALNPAEPTPRYLAFFMGAAVALFVAAYLVGQAVA